MKIIRVLKTELPVPLVVEDADGRFRVLEIAPAREGKLGACVRDGGEALRRLVLKLMSKK